ncbi:hypothetical protein PHYSODRAFT_478218 [Phytophthora sojae]|uniref:HTH myb-type domain-containing protein n=1 Tax=Phytophthora sojae (strain P6497) TaxID=1094619 RepID=G4YU35_PHYSP|nr:hypothetical protein PHYSODRAFT_478218 [Phytophthora sojae]EGZ23113.1 hypothetical protein PHYSODRAFT_478218 [Phytophthora sojae]|eukprot:XP_009518401.1 hypothetical protein PHYSODRAFT_478218 [Phytophthora sojae]
METKNPKTEGLTVEHIKSHLQKYRINYKRSRLEVQRFNEKHATRSSKRHQHRHASEQHGSIDAKIGGEDEASEQHMHATMQQRMDFHRELLLTRSVEFTSGSSWASRMDSQDTYNSSFLQAWAKAEQLRQQEAQVYGRLHQQQQNLFWQQQQPQDSTGTTDDMDLASWGRLSLTVDPDDEDLFGFLA